MQYRDYQIKYIDDVEIDKSNLIISTMRSGKSAILKGIIDKYFKDKKVLIISGMRNVTLQLAEYYDDHSYILSGKEYDPNHNLFLATFQTLIRRDIDLESFDMIAIDEIHIRYNTKIVREIRALGCTRIYMTGTPLTNKGTFLGKFDNVIEHTSIRQMVEDGFLANTKFISKANVLGEDMEVQNGDYKDSEIERVIDKQAMINWLVADNDVYKWSTEHKTILYANSIKTAVKVHTALNDPENIRIMHSKLTDKQASETMEWFHQCKAGMIINVRQLTVGVDIPTADVIVNITPTKILSLFLQTAFRASTKYGDKIATYYDYTGILQVFNPYYNDWQGKKIKLTCTEKCKEFPENSIARHMCLKDCAPNPDNFPICNGELSYTMEQNPYVSGFKVMRGKPCKQGAPVWEWNYKTTEPKGTFGQLIKWAECPNCGCVTAYRLETITQPANTIELYQEEIPQNSLIFIYNPDLKKGLLIVDDIKLISYKYVFIESQMELYEYALNIFKGRPFTVMSNIPLDKLANITINPVLNDFMSLINWENTNQNIIRKILTYKLEKMCENFSMKKGFVYYMKKHITDNNIKKVFKQLGSVQNRHGLVMLSNKLQGK